MKKLLLLLLFTTVSFAAIQAQNEFEVPKNLQFKTEEDYKRYEPDIVAAAGWLEDHDLNTDKNKRKQIDAFVLLWVSGAPNVSVTLTLELSNLFKKNDALMFVYLAAYSRHCIQSDSTTEKESIAAGLKSVFKVYQKGKGIKKNKELAKLVKMSDAELTAYIEEKLIVKAN